jgi:2-polyprenyl-3-methyl-5-hydroxy-6-metoxy-1,4-benzoquinol methylase
MKPPFNANHAYQKVAANFYQSEALIKDSVGAKVSDFYEDAPFPNYEDNETILDIVNKGRQNPFLVKLKNEIGLNKRVIEVGCGTGQLSVFLAHGTNNQCIGFDLTTASVRLGAEFAQKANLNNLAFVNGSLFDTQFEDESFDVIWCSGVLHHTNDPKGGFEHLVSKLKKDGYIIIGLYNSYGRFRTHLRRILFKTFGEKALILDPALRRMKSEAKRKAWINDQYLHPHETCHSFDEVLDWFHEQGIEFCHGIPDFDGDHTDHLPLFEKKSSGTRFSRILNQLLMIPSHLGGEGGLYIVIGQKNRNAD